MSREKLRIANTETDNLLGNLRGEIAEIVTCWILMRRFMVSGTNLRSGDMSKDLSNPDLAFVYLLNDKLEDDLVARLSELAEEKIGRLNFYFVAQKLGRFHDDVRLFSDYIARNGFRKKRNQSISHKELPEKWEDHKAPIQIPTKLLASQKWGVVMLGDHPLALDEYPFQRPRHFRRFPPFLGGIRELRTSISVSPYEYAT